MRLNSLQSLRELQSVGSVPTIKPLNYKRVSIDRSFMSKIDLISYSSSLLLFSSRILRHEISVENRSATLSRVTQEAMKVSSLISKDDWYLHSYTKKDIKKFFKSVGLKPRHISTK